MSGEPYLANPLFFFFYFLLLVGVVFLRGRFSNFLKTIKVKIPAKINDWVNFARALPWVHDPLCTKGHLELPPGKYAPTG